LKTSDRRGRTSEHHDYNRSVSVRLRVEGNALRGALKFTTTDPEAKTSLTYSVMSLNDECKGTVTQSLSRRVKTVARSGSASGLAAKIDCRAL